MSEQYWTPHSAVKEIAKCGFECEAGPLSMNAAWQRLTEAVKVGPEFWPGQGVWFQIEAEAAGKKLIQWAHFFIVGCYMTSDTERRYWEYDLSYDPPAPWHGGTIHFRRISGKRLRLTKPEASDAP